MPDSSDGTGATDENLVEHSLDVIECDESNNTTTTPTPQLTTTTTATTTTTTTTGSEGVELIPNSAYGLQCDTTTTQERDLILTWGATQLT